MRANEADKSTMHAASRDPQAAFAEYQRMEDALSNLSKGLNKRVRQGNPFMHVHYL